MTRQQARRESAANAIEAITTQYRRAPRRLRRKAGRDLAKVEIRARQESESRSSE